jgi:A/G-specific adenine glycosylase
LPVLLATAVERWFRRHQRPLPWRRTYDPYHVWISEVMAQQTRLEVVLAYFERFIARFPTIAALATASDDDVTAAWSGLGYYRRARMLRTGAIDVQQRFGGKLPKHVDDLLTIAGIGRYTAGAVSSIAFNQHAPIVDGNIARITSRLFGIDEPAGSPALMRASWLRAEEMVQTAKTPREFNQGLMEIGALICTPRKAACDRCPLTSHCIAFRTKRTASLPLPRVKESTRELRIPLYVVVDRKGRVLMQRASGRLMDAMFHLPHGNTSLLDGAPMRVDDAQLIGTFKHTVTNRRITFEVWRTRAKNGGRDSRAPRWVDPLELASIPHPSYVRKALHLAGMTAAKAPVPETT